MNLENHGCCIIPTRISGETLNTLRDSLFRDGTPGERCLLDHPTVRETAIALKHELTSTGHLAASSVAIQAIAFNKTATTNWKVAWHQDLMFPFTRKVTADGFDLPEISNRIADHGEIACFANQGEALLMRPLTLHSSSLATAPKHRRILHLVYHSGDPLPEQWHRAI